MVFGSDVGVVLRARRGRNILVQSHGLDVKAVTQAANEVAAVLEGDMPSSIELLDLGAGMQSSLACGHLRVLGNRYAVVYRLLHQVLVVVVSRAHANVFSSLNLVAAISRLLVAEAKSIELTPERLLKKYAQVYLSVDALVNRGRLDLVGALMEANNALEGLSPDALKARKARQAAERQQAAAAGGRQIRQIGRRVPLPHHDHRRFAFLAPPELTSLQVNMPVYQLPELPQPDRPPAQASAPGLTVPLLEEQKAEEEEKPKEGEAWTNFDQQQQQQPSPLLQYQGPPLLLCEAWQVEVAGSRVLRAGLVGAVRWAAPEAKALAGSTPFKLQAPEAPHPLVAAALKCALASERGTRHGAELGSFLADTLSPLPAAAALLQYSLPAHFGVQPLMARLSAGWVEQPRKHKQQQQQQQGAAAVVLLSVQYHIPREFQLAAAGLTVDLAVPQGFEAPRRVEPQGATWSASQSLLRWQLGPAAVPPGAAGSLVAAFRVKAGSEAAAAGIRACRAMLALRGEGATITGVQLAQSRVVSTPAAVEPGSNSWGAFVLARPAC
uniref:MHD domain-containing protein n=1 Tax=Tetradesmus obliquus TaxID=3088 RepID=A0A383W124_TETOB|eukprot:jgi/Sobl393_1/9332/SZX71377.1